MMGKRMIGESDMIDSRQTWPRRGIAVALSALLAFSALGTAPAAYAAEGTDAAVPAAPSAPSATEAPVQSDGAASSAAKAPAPLAFKNAEVVKTLGAKAFTNKLTRQKSVKGTLTYTSSNKKVATVSARGKVKIVGIGRTTIKVKSKVVKGSPSQTAKYTLTVNPKATSIRKVQGAVKGFSVNWKALSKSQADGYQIRYADNKAMDGAKKVTAKKAATTFTLVTGLSNGAKYYVQVRAYKKAKGKAYYSSWSKAKAVTTGLNSGDAELDAIVAKLLASKKLKSGTADKRLKACFNYVAKMRYIRTYETPKGNWSVPFAKEMYNNKGGNCYRYASLFCWLARGLGYDAKAVKGTVPSRSRGQAPHGWVEIKKDGKTWVCDPEMVHVLRGYNLYMMTYKSAPMVYRKSK